MTKLENPPLLEAIFELRWGEVAPGEFSYTQEEQSLFAGKISAAASSRGYGYTERVNSAIDGVVPMLVSHRFRCAQNTWPCFQVGLGIFTINQYHDGYDWDVFKKSIKEGLEIFNLADDKKLPSTMHNLTLVLRYQDGFFPSAQDSMAEYLEKHFNVKATLPDEFLNHPHLDKSKNAVNLKINIDVNKPKGTVTVVIANAVINDKPGLLMETVVVSKVEEAIAEVISTEKILGWAEQAHDLQRHSFKTLISPSAYKK